MRLLVKILKNYDDGPFIQTYTGKHFYPLSQTEDQICIEDIAHHLSLICRYNGAAKYHYSVAQHCCYVSDLCSPENKLWGLLHDAEEAYWGDFAGPLKKELDYGQIPFLSKITKKLICKKFGLPEEEPDEVKYWDRLMLGNEHKVLMDHSFEFLQSVPNLRIDRWGFERAEDAFMYKFMELYNV